MTTENNDLKNKNESLNSSNSMLEIDVACLTDKVSSLMQEIDDLKITLGKFVKGKNNLDTMLGMKVNFQKEGLGYTPPAQNTFKRPINVSHVSKPSTSKYVHAYQKITMPQFNSPKFAEHVNSHALKKNHVIKNSNGSSMSRISCYYCGKLGHHIANCHAKKNSKMIKSVWIPKYILDSFINPQ